MTRNLPPIARVSAEVTTADVVRMAEEQGIAVSATEAAELLQDGAEAHALWMHMTTAGRQYVAGALEARRSRR